ncbi:MAG TPA: ATP-binding cassette domain-containing protein, partial [Bdellovibrionales bacterium]|nr:ATP-binding cassette domain-containing protein [Bdellovibrionales bacterium]
LELRAGEVTGLAGLLGSGRTETARLLFGLDKSDSGTIEIEGREVTLGNPRDAVKHGLAFCPEDRKHQGILPDLSIRENLIIAFQARKGWFRYLSAAEQNALVEHYISALGIVCSGPEQTIRTLSGGNQQKVILARWLASQPRLLILDEPTRGIDVGAKAEIQKLILSLCREGKSVLFISSEIEETVRCSSRVAILRDRKKVTELEGSAVNEDAIMRAIAKETT